MNDTNLKYNSFVENGNKNGQFLNIYYKEVDIAPYTRLYGSVILFNKYESSFW